MNKGFTLIEILIVVAIIAILASVVLVGVGPTQRAGRDSRRISDLQGVRNALELYNNHCGYYPGTANCGATYAKEVSDGVTGYSDLQTAIAGTSAVGIATLPADPTNVKPYQYQYESAAPNSYILAAVLEDGSNAVLRTSIKDANANGTNIDCSGATQSSTYCVGF